MKQDFFEKEENTDGRNPGPAFVPDGNSGPFRWKTTSFSEALLSSVSRPAVPVAAVILIVYLCTGKWEEALLLTAFLLAAVLFTAFIGYRSGVLYSDMCRGLISSPLIRRDGRKFREKWYNLAEGDVIYLSPGTVLPADAKLVSRGKIRVLEQYFDYDNNKKAVRKTEKCQESDGKASGSLSDPSIVYAGSTVLSGSAAAAVIAIGADTEISRRLGGIKIAPTDFRTPSVRKKCSRSALVSNVLLVLAIVFTAVYLVVYTAKGGDGMIGLLRFALILMALLTGSLDKRDGSLYDYLVLRELSSAPCRNPDGVRSFGFFLPMASDDISEADSVLILENSAVADLDAEVRSAFLNSKEYSGFLTGSGDLTGLAEKLLLLKTVRTSALPENEFDSAFERFADVQNADPDYLLHNVSGIQRRLDYPSDGDVSALVTYKGEKEKSEIVTATFDTGVIKKCRFFRDDNANLLPCDLAFEDAAAAYLAGTEKRCLVPVIVTSCASGGDIIVLEGIVSVGGMFPELNTDVTQTLGDYGVHTMLVIPDNSPDSASAARMSGLAYNESNAAIASEYAKDGREVLADFDNINVFSGFGSEGTKKICDRLSADGGKTLTVVGDAASVRNVPERSVLVSVGHNTAGAVNLRCSAGISPASEYSEYTGINALLSMIFSSAAARLKTVLAYRFLIFRMVFLISVTVIPLLTGHVSLVPSPSAILLSVLFSDLLVFFVSDGDSFMPGKLSSARAAFARSDRIVDGLIYASMALLSGIAVSLTGAMAARSSSDDLRGFVFCALLAVPVAALGGLRFSARFGSGLMSVNYRYAAFAAVAVLTVIAVALLPSESGFLAAEVGAGASSARIIPLSLAASAVSGLICWGAGYIPVPEQSDRG